MSDFLNNLKIGDKVLLCHDNGEVYDVADISRLSDDKRIEVHNRSLPWQDSRFSRKTGKQHGGSLTIQSYDEKLFQAHLQRQAEMTAVHKAKEQQKRLVMQVGILEQIEAVDMGSLGSLSDADLRTLKNILNILNKLGV